MVFMSLNLHGCCVYLSEINAKRKMFMYKAFHFYTKVPLPVALARGLARNGAVLVRVALLVADDRLAARRICPEKRRWLRIDLDQGLSRSDIVLDRFS
jgi:hypothetical protein